MPRWLRWTLVSVVAFAVLVVVVLALLPTFIDVNRYRDRVVAEVERALGREITLDRLSLAFLPSPTLGLGGLVIGVQGAPDTGPIPPGERFVALDRLDLKLRLLPLLARRVEVSRLVLERPQIVVERDARGVLSIADLMGGAPAPQPGASPEPAPSPGGPSPLAALLVERIEIRSGTLTFRDRAVVSGKEVTTTVADLGVTLQDLSLDRPVRADLKATFLSRTPENVTLSGTLGPVGPQIDLLGAPADLVVALVDLDLEQVAAYAGARSTRTRAAGAPASPLTLAGTGGLRATVKGPLGAPALDATADLTPAAVAYGSAFTKRPGVPLTLVAKTTSGQVGSGTPVVQVNPLTLTLHTLTLTAAGRIVNPTNPVLDLAVTSNEARLAGWDALVPGLAGTALNGRATLEATVRGPAAGGAASLDVAGTLKVAGLSVRHPSLPEPISDGEATVTFTGKGAAVEPLRATIGRSSLVLRADMPDYSRRYVRFALESPRLDLDPLIAGAAATSGGAPGPAVTPNQAPIPASRRAPARPGAAVAGLSADGTVRVQQGTLKGVEFTDLRGGLKLRDRVLTLDQLAFGLYGGQYTGTGTADLRGRVPAVTFSSRLVNVKANDILSANTSLKGVVYGLLSANLDVKGSGLDGAQFLDSLAGAGKFSLNDGRFATIDVLDRLQALATLAKEGQAPPPASGQKGTPVKSLASSVRIEEGKFITPDLDLSTGDFGLTGSGAVGFDQGLAYNLRAAIPGPLARQLFGRDVSRLLAADASGRVEIPFTLGGTLTSPTFGLSPRFLEERLKAKLGDSVEQGLQRGLERLLRGREPQPAASPGAQASPGGQAAASPAPAPAASPTPKPDPKQILRDLFK